MGSGPRGAHIDEPRTGYKGRRVEIFNTSLAKLFFGENDAKACRNAWRFFSFSPRTMSFIVRELT